MSEYKENTVGWWLSQLKEPLKSRALGPIELGDKYHNEPCNSLKNALWRVAMEPHDDGIRRFWIGACDFFDGLGNNDLGSVAQGGWYMAEKCAPDNWLKPKDGGKDKAIVDSPKKTTELFFYASDETLINPLQNPFKEPLVISPRGETNSVIVEEDKIKDLMNANPGVTFWPTNVGATCLMCNGAGSYEDQDGCWDCGTCDGEGKIVADSPEKPKNWIDQELWKWHTDMVKGGVEYADAERGKVKLLADSPAPDHPLWKRCEAIGATNDDSNILVKYQTAHGDYWWFIKQIFGRSEDSIIIIDRTKGVIYSRWPDDDTLADNLLQRFEQDSFTINFPAREIEAPERAVVGYEEPKPIDTIEKKHELRIKNLEAQVIQLEGVVGKLEQQIEYVYRNLPKDFDGTR